MESQSVSTLLMWKTGCSCRIKNLHMFFFWVFNLIFSSYPWLPSLLMLPSGNLTELWNITIFNWKIHYKWPFSIAMLVYQRVVPHFDRESDKQGPLVGGFLSQQYQCPVPFVGGFLTPEDQKKHDFWLISCYIPFLWCSFNPTKPYKRIKKTLFQWDFRCKNWSFLKKRRRDSTSAPAWFW